MAVIGMILKRDVFSSLEKMIAQKTQIALTAKPEINDQLALLQNNEGGVQEIFDD